MIVHLFLYFFYQSTSIPTLVGILVSYQIIILHGEPTHTTSKGSNGVTRPSYINNRLKVKYPLCNFVSYAQAITQ